MKNVCIQATHPFQLFTDDSNGGSHWLGHTKQKQKNVKHDTKVLKLWPGQCGGAKETKTDKDTLLHNKCLSPVGQKVNGFATN